MEKSEIYVVSHPYEENCCEIISGTEFEKRINNNFYQIIISKGDHPNIIRKYILECSPFKNSIDTIKSYFKSFEVGIGIYHNLNLERLDDIVSNFEKNMEDDDFIFNEKLINDIDNHFNIHNTGKLITNNDEKKYHTISFFLKDKAYNDVLIFVYDLTILEVFKNIIEKICENFTIFEISENKNDFDEYQMKKNVCEEFDYDPKIVISTYNFSHTLINSVFDLVIFNEIRKNSKNVDFFEPKYIIYNEMNVQKNKNLILLTRKDDEGIYEKNDPKLSIKINKRNISFIEKIYLLKDMEKNGLINKIRKNSSLSNFVFLCKRNFRQGKITHEKLEILKTIKYFSDWLNKCEEIKKKIEEQTKLILEFEQSGNNIEDISIDLENSILYIKKLYRMSKLTLEGIELLKTTKIFSEWFQKEEHKSNFEKKIDLVLDFEKSKSYENNETYRNIKLFRFLREGRKKYTLKTLPFEKLELLKTTKFFNNWLKSKKHLNHIEKIKLVLEFEKNGELVRKNSIYNGVNLGNILKKWKCDFKKNKINLNVLEIIKQSKTFVKWMDSLQ